MTLAAGAACVALLAAHATAAGAQRVAVGAGVAVASRLLVDGNGTTGRLRPAPFLAIEVARPPAADGGTSLAAGARVAFAGIRASGGGSRWSAGSAVQADLTVGAARPVGGGVRARLAVGATALAGPRDVRPFDGTRVAPLAEAGADVPIGAAFRADVRVQGYRLAPRDGAAGGVVRLLVGVARAR